MTHIVTPGDEAGLRRLGCRFTSDPYFARHTAKGRIFLAIVYSVLALGGLTMVLPFLIMLASSISGPYDYNRHSPVVRALWDRNDRFMRSLATYFPRFPREIYPDAPESWGSWATVARDTDGIAAFAAKYLAPAQTNDAVRADWKRRADLGHRLHHLFL